MALIGWIEPALARSYLNCLTRKVVIVDTPRRSTSSSVEEHLGFWIDEAAKTLVLGDGTPLTVHRFDDHWISAARGDTSYEFAGLRHVAGGDERIEICKQPAFEADDIVVAGVDQGIAWPVVAAAGQPFVAKQGIVAGAAANVVVKLDAADQITMRNVSLSQLSAKDFVFVGQPDNRVLGALSKLSRTAGTLEITVLADMGVVYWGFRSRDPAENRRPAGHPGIATDAAKAFAVGAGTALRKSRSARVGLPGSLRKNVTCSVCQAIRALGLILAKSSDGCASLRRPWKEVAGASPPTPGTPLIALAKSLLQP
jgi:hypothetical protein